MTLERIGPYRIVRLLGKGGMGAVYEAFHEAIERRVAIKVLHSELGMRADIAARFFNEPRAEVRRRQFVRSGVPGNVRGRQAAQGD